MNDAIEMTSDASNVLAGVSHLSGLKRGLCELLTHDKYYVTTNPDGLIHIVEQPEGDKQNIHAILNRHDSTYKLEVIPERNVWVNDHKIKEYCTLKSGDLLEVGVQGPIYRYRLYPSGVENGYPVKDIIADCYKGANIGNSSYLNKLSHFCVDLTQDIATKTTLLFRICVSTILIILISSVVYLLYQNLQLRKQVISERETIANIEKQLEEQSASKLSKEEMLSMRSELEHQLSDTFERLQQLEQSSSKASDIIASVSPSVVFLLGTYGYVEPETGSFFRMWTTEDGIITRYGFDQGKIVENPFTGTAFVISNDGLLLTNRHVIHPWDDSEQMQMIQGRELIPTIIRLSAYYPELADPITITEQHISQTMDLALLRTEQTTNNLQPLSISSAVVKPGNEVLLLGYPTGLRALVARTSEEVLKALPTEQENDIWSVASLLSGSGYIKPLATRGIIGQISEQFIVYDAETTFGGSGGPVFDLNAEVVAVNSALIPGFSGSNMGVPAHTVIKFLSEPKFWTRVGYR